MEKIETRSELTGKRIVILLNSDAENVSLDSSCEKWEFNKSWKSAIVRCLTSVDDNNKDLVVCVEWLNEPWQDREWITFSDCAYVFIEDRVVVTKHPTKKQSLPALTFLPHQRQLDSSEVTLIHFFDDEQRLFVNTRDLTYVDKEVDLMCQTFMKSPTKLAKDVKDWLQLQKTQKILIENSFCLAGTRVQVYWPNSSVQWNSAVITGHDIDGLLQIMTDLVLTQTSVDPRYTQVRFLDASVISEIIPDGVQQVIRRSRRSTRYNSSSSTDNPLKPIHKPRLGKRRSCVARVSSQTTTDLKTSASLPNSPSRKPSPHSSPDHGTDEKTTEEKNECSLSSQENSVSEESTGKQTDCESPKTFQVSSSENSQLDKDEEDTKNAASVLLSMSNHTLHANAVKSDQESDDHVSLNNHKSTSPHEKVMDENEGVKSSETTSSKYLCDNSTEGEPQDEKSSNATDDKNPSEEIKIKLGESSSTMHQGSPNARALSAMANHQALQQQQQQQHQQQSQSHQLQQQLQALPQHFLAPYLNPYGLPFLYSNPALATAGLNQSAMAAHFQAVAAAGNGIVPPNLTSWFKQTFQQDLIEKEMISQQQQQQVLANYALLGANREALAAAASAYPYGLDPSVATQKVAPHSVIIDSKDHLGKISSEQHKHDRRHEQMSSPCSSKPNSKKSSYPSTQQTKTPQRHPVDPLAHHFSPGRQMSSPHHPHHSSEAIEKEREKMIRRQEEEKRYLEEKQRIMKMEEERDKMEDKWRKTLQENQNERSRQLDHRMKTESLSSASVHPRPYPDKSIMSTFPIAMVDPATYMAANPHLFDKKFSEATRNSSRSAASTPDHGKPPAPQTSAPSQPPAIQSVASSSKIWQPPLPEGANMKEDPQARERQKSSPKRVQKKPTAQTSSSHHQPVTSSMAMPPHWPYLTHPAFQHHLVAAALSKTNPSSAASSTQSVININSLKYSPSGQKLTSPKPLNEDVHIGGVHPEKGLSIKRAKSYRETQSVKYINERDAVNHKPPQQSPSPEKLGPLMQDGTHARILSPAALNNLYRFPGPSDAKPTIPSSSVSSTSSIGGTSKPSNSVIMDGGHYRVMEVHGSNENIPTTSSKPSHIVYPKHAHVAKMEEPIIVHDSQAPPAGEMEVDKNNRKRISHDANVISSAHKKPCTDPLRPETESSIEKTASRNPSSTVSSAQFVPKFSSNSGNNIVLSELAAAGLMNMSPHDIVWGLSSQAGHYPGAPSKLALKDALLGRRGDGMKQTAEPIVNLPHVRTNGSAHPQPTPSQSTAIIQNQIPSKEVNDVKENHSPVPMNLSSKPNPVEPQTIVPQKFEDNHPPQPQQPLPMIQDNLKPKTLQVEPAPVEPPKVKTPTASVAVSPSSDASSISDFSCSSSSSKTHPGLVEGVTNQPPASKPPAAANCPKLKKAWLARMSDESDDATRSPANNPMKRKNSGDLCVSSPVEVAPVIQPAMTPPEAVSTCEEKPNDDGLAPPLKKPKKKHRKQEKEKDKEKKTKDPNKKKRKHKDKDTKRSKKSPDHHSESSLSPQTHMNDHVHNNDVIGDDGKSAMSKCQTSNSKKYLLGLLNSSAPPSDEDDASDKEVSADHCESKKSKKKLKKSKDFEEMPLGENGLPMSVLHCKKQQSKLKRSGEAFIQDAACHEITAILGISNQTTSNGSPTLTKCRECRSIKRKENTTIFCRFYGFRKLAFMNGLLQAAGFCDPEDSNHQDLSRWLPVHNDNLKINTTTNMVTSAEENSPSLDLEACKFVMGHIGGQFCELVNKEREALFGIDKHAKVFWKRPVSGVREMCDACETTLFNLHWVCPKCGFCVCSDCFNARLAMKKEELEAYDSDKNNLYRWLRCTKGKHHLPQHLMPTQIIPSTSLFDLCEMAHQARTKWNIGFQCRCRKLSSTPLQRSVNNPTPLFKNHCHNEMLSKTNISTKNDSKQSNKDPNNRFKSYDCENAASPLDWLASIALREQRKSSPTATKTNPGDDKPGTTESKALTETNKKTATQAKVYGGRVNTWMCNGALPQINDPSTDISIEDFQMHWFCGMPVVTSGGTKHMKRELWKPEAICAEHGEEPTRNALINCKEGSVITNAQIKDFWNGFECIANRLRDEKTGEKMILKLKDWPTTDDFIDTMPAMFDDLMKALPLPSYTSREGKFNLAAHLPDFFVRPDLGPKMYIAYGWVTEDDWSQGTTNLHLDISDACNLMVYVGVPKDEPPSAMDSLIKIIKEGDVDSDQIERAKHHKPGALWHIFKPCDTDKIRKLITKVKMESGTLPSNEHDHDPIHDQQIYLDKKLRKRLLEEYGVESYPIVQCEGDSVFIPAGAPHQVFNLHSCIKVAEDFVSPEHVDKCHKLMEEFRHLSSSHSNHEDKLQLKNIIYHSMKEVVSALSWHGARAAETSSLERSTTIPSSCSSSNQPPLG